MIALFQSVSIGILVFFLVYCVVTLTLLALSVREISWYARGQEPTRTRPGGLAHQPSVTLVAPAYNEETLIVQSAKAFLASDYAPLEVIVSNDGSKDETFARLDEAFDLVALPLRGRTALPTEQIRGVYISRVDPRLRVVDKENGGRSDAVNAGISVARGELVVIVDSDSLLEIDAIRRAVRPFEVHPDTCLAVGGDIRVANGSTIVDGRIVRPGVQAGGIGATQVLEYLRGFLGSRIGWSELNAMLIISGAFGVFRRDVLVALGGLSRSTLGEDMELTMRIHRFLRPGWREARVEFAPDAVCWTEAPGTLGGLRSQRVRWHAGLLDNLRLHWRMFGRPRYGLAGMLALPYAVLFEAVEPLIEVVGFGIVVTLVVYNQVNWPYLLAFFLVAILTGQVLNVTALLIEEIGFRRYRGKDLLLLAGWGLVEAVWFRPCLAWWRLKATLFALIGRRPGWGTIPRGATLEKPVEVVEPLTR